MYNYHKTQFIATADAIIRNLTDYTCLSEILWGVNFKYMMLIDQDEIDVYVNIITKVPYHADLCLVAFDEVFEKEVHHA